MCHTPFWTQEVNRNQADQVPASAELPLQAKETNKHRNNVISVTKG